jgi:catechol 2,3-dioxygenase-like lactoylglutathione lyase family enzyme
MIDHVGIRVRDLALSAEFYRRALRPLGYGVLMEFDFGVGLGRDGKPDLWLYPGEPPAESVHIAVAATNRSAVRAFHAAALDAGGTERDAPRLWPEYHPSYYGAFVTDPNGYNLEAVCHAPG